MAMDCHTDTSPEFERHARAKRARIDATNGLGADIQADSRHLQHAIAAMSKSVEANASKVTTEVRSPMNLYLRLISVVDYEICSISSSLSEICLGTLSFYAREDRLAGQSRQ
jgi:hypothetical protein